MKHLVVALVVALVALVAACVPDHAAQVRVHVGGGEGEGEGAGEGEGVAGEGEGDGGPLWDGVVDRDRSLVWTTSTLLDDPATISLSRVLGAAGGAVGVDAGTLLDRWFARFATTAHSERAGPAQLAAQLHDTLGADPSTWNVDDAPFKVTGIHNRIDLKGRDDDGNAHCGQLRVSFASTDPIFKPFHMLFLFRQPAVDGDVDTDSRDVTCEQTALRWAELSDDDADAFAADARAIVDEGVVAERFLLAESVELTVSPWEWRQWTPTGDPATPLDNPPLFEQVDAEHINAAGPLRDDFLAFVDDNAAALDARTLLLPDRFRAPSTRVTQGVAWVPLDLPSTDATSSFPDLRRNIEIVGCAACHTADAEFVQTKEDRTFSEFYRKELIARGTLLSDILHRTPHAIPFGPLQPSPVLPP